MNYPPATTLDSLFDQFLKERTYLKNVTPCTLVWYRTAFKNYRAALARRESMWPTKAALQQFAISMRERGVRPVTCNTNIGAMNAFCLWLHQEGHATEHVKLAKMRVEHRVLQLLDDTQMRALVHYKPQTFRQPIQTGHGHWRSSSMSIAPNGSGPSARSRPCDRTKVMTGSEYLLDRCNARPSTQQLRCDRHALHTIGDGSAPLATMIDEFLLEIWSHEVAHAGRHARQHVHNFHARRTARCQPDGLRERRVRSSAPRPAGPRMR